VSTQPLTSEDKGALQAAAELHRPLARAAAVGRSNALGYVIFGGLTLLMGVSGPDVPGLAIGVILTGVGVGQLRAVPRLKHGDPEATRTLARNELLLMAGIIGYSVLKLTVLREVDPALKQADTGDLGLDLGELADSLTTAVYSTFIAVTLIYQGGLSLYYKRRRPMAERYLAEAPEWAREVVESVGH